MKQTIVEYLKCPACLPHERDLVLYAREIHGDDVIEGYLECRGCNTRYSITDGVAILLPSSSPSGAGAPSKYESPEVLSSYLWSHYADLFADPEATTAYGRWAALIHTSAGITLDTGCAVGRFTFELGCKSDFAIGLDYSLNFIRTARELLKKRRIDFNVIEEGRLQKKCTVELPDFWDSSKMEFIVADAQRLPFGSALFSSVASLNLVDKLPNPLLHLKELNRVTMDHAAQLLFSDPFSWSTDVAMEEDWLGGLVDGKYAGSGIDNIAALLEGRDIELLPPWNIQDRGGLWWKIRSHRNHYELIRSCFLKAVR